MTDPVIQFELVSPEEKLVSEPVYHAVLPGEEGEFGIGADHTSLVVSLQPGVVKLYRQKGAEPQKIFIAGGFADVTGVNCTILAEDAVDVANLNQADLEQDIKNLTEDLTAAEGIEKSRVQRRLSMTKAKLQAVTGKVVF
ncbi:MAG: ATP synthase F1 subunit epsilon [Alphaproteobacteria bacterium]